MSERRSEPTLYMTMNEQPVAYRVEAAVNEEATVASLLENAELWESRANGDDDLYSLDR